MRLLKRSMLAVFVFAALAVMARASFAEEGAKANQADDGLIGSWTGTLKNESLIFFQISRRWDGGLKASFGNAVASGNWMDSVAFADGKVKLVSKAAALSFEGTLNSGGKLIKGTLTRGRGKSPLELTKVDKLPGPNRPQTPRAPFPYEVRDVHYRNEAADIILAGTLTLPRGAGPFPAVLLIAGSGADDRNEEALFHRPFEVLADYLTRRGIAVLRVDKRGVGESQGDWAASGGPKDFATDALAGLKYLSGLPEIDPKRMGLLGQSEGGMVAPIAATQSDDVSFIVSLAGPAMNWPDLIALQDATEAVVAGATDEQAGIIRAWSTRYYAIARDTADPVEAHKLLEDLKATRTPAERAAYKFLGDVGTLNIDEVLQPWCLACLRLDPGVYLAKTKCPVLELFAEKDCQVPPVPNLQAAEAAFKASGNSEATAMILPGLNHCFMRCKTGAVEEYAEIEETLAPDALKLIGDWIAAHTKSPK